MVISIYQVNKVEAQKGGGGGEYHAGKVVEYLGRPSGLIVAYLVQFEDNTKEPVIGDLREGMGVCIKVGSQ